MNEPANTPSFAWFNNSAPTPGIPAKERLAIKRATVKPIPPNIDTPKRFLLLTPSGIVARRKRTKRYVNRKMPSDFPTNRPANTANGIPGNELIYLQK